MVVVPKVFSGESVYSLHSAQFHDIIRKYVHDLKLPIHGPNTTQRIQQNKAEPRTLYIVINNVVRDAEDPAG